LGAAIKMVLGVGWGDDQDGVGGWLGATIKRTLEHREEEGQLGEVGAGLGDDGGAEAQRQPRRRTGGDVPAAIVTAGVQGRLALVGRLNPRRSRGCSRRAGGAAKNATKQVVPSSCGEEFRGERQQRVEGAAEG